MARSILIIICLFGSVFTLPDCNFDDRDHWCDWVQALDDNYQWKARQYPTFATGTGPQGDHTTGTGWYIYTDSRQAESSGWTARLISPTIEGSVDTPTTVISFWYSMWDEMGDSMGTLNVYTMHNDKMGEPVWSKSGARTKKGEWKEARIPLYSAGVFQVVFESVKGPGDASDIGIDDVSFTQAPLPDTCDFESSAYGPLCGFFQEDESDHFDWTWNAGETPSLDTGPLVDHTFDNESGHYIFIETTRPGEEKAASLRSFEYYKQQGRCTLEFFYHAFGDNLGGLNVFIQDVRQDFEITESADEWKRERIGFDDVSGRYTIRFSGVRGDGNLGDIALDDIRIYGPGCFDVDVCASDPCYNGAACSEDGNNFYCNCTSGWTGVQCDLDISDCWSSPCPEPRVCNDLNNGYECLCPPGWLGEDCEIPENPPPREPEKTLDPDQVNIIVTCTVIAAVVVLTCSVMTVYCTRQRKSIDSNDGVKLTSNVQQQNGEGDEEGAYAMKDVLDDEDK